MEEWRCIPGYRNCYQVSSLGRVRSNLIPGSHKEGTSWHIVTPSTHPGGYKRVNVGRNRRLDSVHRLVAMAFIPNPNNWPCINHKNENPSDNRVENLEWCTVKYNTNYGTARAKISASQINHPCRSRPVWQFTLDGKFIAKYPSTKEAERQLGISRYSIQHQASGVTKSAITGFIWSYTENPINVVSRYSLYKPKAVCQYTLDMQLVKEYPSQAIAARECHISQGNIGECCAGRRRKAGGFIWRFKKCVN